MDFDGGLLDAVLEYGLDAVVDFFKDIFDIISSIFDFVDETMDITFLSNDLLLDINKAAEALIGSGVSDYQGSIAYKVYESMIPIGVTLMMVFFGMRLVDLAMNQEVNVESFAKLFGYMILMLLVLDNGYMLMMKCYEAICSSNDGIGKALSDSLKADFPVSQIYDPSAGFQFTIPEDINWLNPAEAWEAIQEIFGEVINSITRLPWILISPVFSLIASVLIMVSFNVALSMRAIKLAVHMSFAPVAFASIFDDNISTTKAVNHFKKILSLFLQGPLILIMMRLTSYSVSTANTGSYFSGIISLFFCVSMIKKAIKGSEQRADQMLGVS